ncbi:MAG: hypothetical protein WC107_01975 [Patescibacteria group bacterium]
MINFAEFIALLAKVLCAKTIARELDGGEAVCFFRQGNNPLTMAQVFAVGLTTLIEMTHCFEDVIYSDSVIDDKGQTALLWLQDQRIRITGNGEGVFCVSLQPC